MKHFAIIELENSEAMSIGVINNITNTPQGIQSLKERFLKSCGQHFDAEDFNYSAIPDLFTGSPYGDVDIEIDGMNYTVRIMETWMY